MKSLNRLLTWGIGGWFAYTGFTKIFVSGLDQFLFDITRYQLLQSPWDAVLAYTLPWAEIIAGFSLLLGLWRRASILMISGLTFLFACGISQAAYRGLVISCGCTGRSEPVNYTLKFLELAFYLLSMLFLWWQQTRISKLAIAAEEHASKDDEC